MKLPPLPPGIYEGADAAWVLCALVVAAFVVLALMRGAHPRSRRP